jgi:hypothetical protein
MASGMNRPLSSGRPLKTASCRETKLVVFFVLNKRIRQFFLAALVVMG